MHGITGSGHVRPYIHTRMYAPVVNLLMLSQLQLKGLEHITVMRGDNFYLLL